MVVLWLLQWSCFYTAVSDPGGESADPRAIVRVNRRMILRSPTGDCP